MCNTLYYRSFKANKTSASYHVKSQHDNNFLVDYVNIGIIQGHNLSSEINLELSLEEAKKLQEMLLEAIEIFDV